LAVREMLDFLTKEKGISREDAYMLCTLAVDLRVTEFVDNPKGVRAMIPKSIFQKNSALNSERATGPFDPALKESSSAANDRVADRENSK